MTTEQLDPASAADLESFREEAGAWIDAHAAGVGAPVDAFDITWEQHERNHAFLRALGKKGWYAPGWPSEYGGGGLPKEKVRVIFEELERRIPQIQNVRLPGDVGGPVAASVWMLGAEEQKRRFLPPVLRAEVISWELYTEPEAGSDLPSLKTRALRQGDNYVINGTKIFVGGNFAPDQFYVLAVTDPNGRRHENLSVFVVPADSPGVTITDLIMIAGHRKRTIALDNVVVPAANRVGQEGDGWRSFGSMFAGQAFGPVGLGTAGERTLKVLNLLLDYARSRTPGSTRLIDRPGPRTALTKAWMEGQVDRLLTRRNQAMAAASQPFSYESGQSMLCGKLYALTLSGAIQKVLGPLANIADLRWAPEEGELEYFQRQAIVNTHPGGTCETQKTRMFRGMAALRPNLVEKVAKR